MDGDGGIDGADCGRRFEAVVYVYSCSSIIDLIEI